MNQPPNLSRAGSTGNDGECGNQHHHEVVAGAMVMVHVSWNALSTRGSTRSRGCRSGACGRHSGRWCSRNRTPAGTRPKESTRRRTSAPGSARPSVQRSAPEWARPSAPRRAQEYRRRMRTILGSARSAPWSRPAPASAQEYRRRTRTNLGRASAQTSARRNLLWVFLYEGRRASAKARPSARL